MELILVRHGQPAWSTPDGRGRNDPGLTDLGHAQARAAAARLADHGEEPAPGPVDRLVVSPAVRAQETAAPIVAATGLEANTLDWLWEIRSAPEWEGQPIEEVEARFARAKLLTRQQMWDGLPGAESVRDFHQRIVGGLTGFLAELGIAPSAEPGLWEVDGTGPDRVVAVAHGGTNSTIIAHLLNVALEPYDWDRFVMGHASVAVLATTPMAGAHIWSLRAMGDGGHLALGDRTY